MGGNRTAKILWGILAFLVLFIGLTVPSNASESTDLPEEIHSADEPVPVELNTYYRLNISADVVIELDEPGYIYIDGVGMPVGQTNQGYRIYNENKVGLGMQIAEWGLFHPYK